MFSISWIYPALSIYQTLKINDKELFKSLNLLCTLTLPSGCIGSTFGRLHQPLEVHPLATSIIPWARAGMNEMESNIRDEHRLIENSFHIHHK